MTPTMIRTMTAICVALTVVLTVAGCTASSPEAIRKEAQSNADKYVEYMKAGDFASAYDKTMHSDYKRQLPLETFVKFREGMTNTFGAVESYQVVHYDADPERQSVTLTYSVKYSKVPEIGQEIIMLRREGTEWRVMSVEPKMPQKPQRVQDMPTPIAPPAPQAPPPAAPPK